MQTSRRGGGRPAAALAASALGLFGLVGCQAEYAGMTLPSGKYLFDDIQYFEPGPHFRWANTQAATQRARMEAMGIDPDADVGRAATEGRIVPGEIPAEDSGLGMPGGIGPDQPQQQPDNTGPGAMPPARRDNPIPGEEPPGDVPPPADTDPNAGMPGDDTDSADSDGPPGTALAPDDNPF